MIFMAKIEAMGEGWGVWKPEIRGDVVYGCSLLNSNSKRSLARKNFIFLCDAAIQFIGSGLSLNH